jgi:hypothetical protein
MEATSMHDNVITFVPTTRVQHSNPKHVSHLPEPADAAAAAIVRFSSPEKTRRGQEIMQEINTEKIMADLAGGVSTDIGLNERLRDARKAAWRRAEAKTAFLGSQREYDFCIDHAQRCGVSCAGGLPVLDAAGKFELVERWRLAVLEQLLTPAPRYSDLAWKCRKVASLSEYDWTGGVTPDRVERAIAHDEAFFAAFPARSSPNRPKPPSD